MEPIAAQSHPIALRPVAGGQTKELANLLREGRVLAGEVLQSLADGSVLIGIGRHRVPAQTHMRLDPGHHFLFQVEAAGDQILLRILAPGGEDGGSFWRYLRTVIGLDRPLGELMHELAQHVRAELDRPGQSMEALTRLLAGLERAASLPEGAAELRTLLARSGLLYETALLAAAAHGTPELLDELGRDLKGELLRALGDLPDGPLKEAVARALSGLEAEQLLNLARAHSGEAQVLSLPLPDAEGWTTARLLVQPRRDGERGSGGGEAGAEEPVRLVLGVTFSRTGPLRAELVSSRAGLGVRILATKPELVARLRRDAPALEALLGRGERPARVTVAEGTLADVAVGSRLIDIPLLCDNHVMDVRG